MHAVELVFAVVWGAFWLYWLIAAVGVKLHPLIALRCAAVDQSHAFFVVLVERGNAGIEVPDRGPLRVRLLVR